MLGIGIIGAGHFGAAHSRALGSVQGARLVAACRNDPAGLAAFTAEFGGKGYVDYRDLLADPAVDAVVVALPHHLHTDVAIACAKAGKHIMIEKPVAPTVAECRSILAAA
ncbi:MAG TPA: Gfo/Idh/MocA family oxidoreductase, partial [Mycoplana sp.]|nr:Gfo/Idh/MocA family oxidoreductase [Mycoplana sp.]